MRRTIEIVAGPNGSGKTTFAESVLFNAGQTTVFLNPDVIAAGIAPLDFEKASFHAGRLIISEIQERLAKQESFAFESTLSGRTWLHFLNQAKAQDYQVTVYFLFLSSIQKNLSRISKRVRLGGHPIPEEAVRRRHLRCFHNFWNLYRPLCTDWHIFDNSKKQPKSILSKDKFELLADKDAKTFVSSFLKGNPKHVP